MPAKKSSTRTYRHRKKLKAERDIVRVEVMVPASGADEIRELAKRLRAPSTDALAEVEIVPHGESLGPFLQDMARRYFWWKRPEDLLGADIRVALQVMDIGTFDDMQQLARLAGDEFLRTALRSAEPGNLSPRSWAYWHCRLGDAPPVAVPPLPSRSYA